MSIVTCTAAAPATCTTLTAAGLGFEAPRLGETSCRPGLPGFYASAMPGTCTARREINRSDAQDAYWYADAVARDGAGEMFTFAHMEARNASHAYAIALAEAVKGGVCVDGLRKRPGKGQTWATLGRALRDAIEAQAAAQWIDAARGERFGRWREVYYSDVFACDGRRMVCTAPGRFEVAEPLPPNTAAGPTDCATVLGLATWAAGNSCGEDCPWDMIGGTPRSSAAPHLPELTTGRPADVLGTHRLAA